MKEDPLLPDTRERAGCPSVLIASCVLAVYAFGIVGMSAMTAYRNEMAWARDSESGLQLTLVGACMLDSNGARVFPQDDAICEGCVRSTSIVFGVGLLCHSCLVGYWALRLLRRIRRRHYWIEGLLLVLSSLFAGTSAFMFAFKCLPRAVNSHIWVFANGQIAVGWWIGVLLIAVPWMVLPAMMYVRSAAAEQEDSRLSAQTHVCYLQRGQTLGRLDILAARGTEATVRPGDTIEYVCGSESQTLTVFRTVLAVQGGFRHLAQALSLDRWKSLYPHAASYDEALEEASRILCVDMEEAHDLRWVVVTLG